MGQGGTPQAGFGSPELTDSLVKILPPVMTVTVAHICPNLSPLLQSLSAIATGSVSPSHPAGRATVCCWQQGYLFGSGCQGNVTKQPEL